MFGLERCTLLRVMKSLHDIQEVMKGVVIKLDYYLVTQGISIFYRLLTTTIFGETGITIVVVVWATQPRPKNRWRNSIETQHTGDAPWS